MAAKQTVTTEEVEKIAHLAKLHLSDEQRQLYTSQINKILAHVGTLDKVDIAGVEPLSHVLELVNVSRADEAGQSLPRETAMANAPVIRKEGDTVERASDGEFFLVPGVLKTDS